MPRRATCRHPPRGPHRPEHRIPGHHASWHHTHRRRRWGLRRRLTFAFTFVALAAVFLTTWFTLGAVFDAQRELFQHESPPLNERSWGGARGDNGSAGPGSAAREAFGRIVRTAFIAGLASFFLASGAAAFVTRFLTRPLTALTDGAKRLADGERGIRLRVPPAEDELRLVTESFNHLVEGLERQEAWRRNLVADIAHDLRTPLAVMRSEIEAMQDGVVTLDQDGLERLHSEVLMLSRLVDDMRTLSLAESGGLSLKLERTRIRPLLQHALDTFASRALDVSVTLQLDAVPDDLSATLDRDRIVQVVRNLLDNAIRYAAPGPVEVGAEREGDWVHIQVRDHGPGLPPEALERVFERFYRGDVARTRGRGDEGNGGGSGLGLAIARAIAEAHGGTLEAENHPEGGALFTLHLPESPLA
jgi:two-component system sensor histidine kinase BaeS